MSVNMKGIGVYPRGVGSMPINRRRFAARRPLRPPKPQRRWSVNTEADVEQKCSRMYLLTFFFPRLK